MVMAGMHGVAMSPFGALVVAGLIAIELIGLLVLAYKVGARDERKRQQRGAARR